MINNAQNSSCLVGLMGSCSAFMYPSINALQFEQGEG